MKRRNFINTAAHFTVTSGLLTAYIPQVITKSEAMTAQIPPISLAQWSLHKALFDKRLNAEDFPQKAASLGIHAVEYVNQFYKEQSLNESFWQSLKKRADSENVLSLLIMVDDEGELGTGDSPQRKKAVENHYKWVHAAKLLGCHSIRVNAFGQGSKDAQKNALVDGLGSLCEYSAQEDINVLIENHGFYSSDADWVVSVIEQVNSAYLGTLPDFGNWCLNAEWGSTMNGKCTDSYDLYEGVQKFLPYAKGVSAKSYNFNDQGEQRDIDYTKMLKVVKDFGYNGYIGIEYEGDQLSEEEGILATKRLIESTWSLLD